MFWDFLGFWISSSPDSQLTVWPFGLNDIVSVQHASRALNTAIQISDVLANNPDIYPRQKPGRKKDYVKPAHPSTLPGYDPKTKVRGYLFDMEEYFTKNVERYKNETSCS